jgi:hypothetical protein
MTWTQTHDCTLSPDCPCDYCSSRWGLAQGYKKYLETKHVRYLRSIKSLYAKSPQMKRLDQAVDFLSKELSVMTEKEEGHDEDEDDDEDVEGDDQGDGEACDCDCQACKEKPGRHDRGCENHPCEGVDDENKDMCYLIWEELTQLQDQLDTVQEAVNVAEGIDDLNKALSSLNESTGGALMPPSVRPSSVLAGRLDQLRGRRDAVQDRLRALGVQAVRRSRQRPAKRRGRTRPWPKKR